MPKFVVATPPPLSDELPVIVQFVIDIGAFAPSSIPPARPFGPAVATLLLTVTPESDVLPTLLALKMPPASALSLVPIAVLPEMLPPVIVTVCPPTPAIRMPPPSDPAVLLSTEQFEKATVPPLLWRMFTPPAFAVMIAEVWLFVMEQLVNVTF